MKSKIIFIILFFVSSAGLTKVTPRKPSQTSGNFEMVVNFGERITHFTLNRGANGGILSMQNNLGKKGVHKLSKDDLDFIASQVAGTARESTPTANCGRAYVTLISQDGQFNFCMNSNSKAATNVRQLANLFSIYF